MEDLFYEFIQVALNTREKLSQTPSNEEWMGLYQLCQKQAIVGISFLSLDRLSKNGKKPPVALLYDWLGKSTQIKYQNQIVNINAVSLCEDLQKEGFDCCILKGLGNNLIYPDVYARSPGDIDAWVCAGRNEKADLRGIIRHVKERNPKGKAVYHHADFGLYQGTEVEVHYRPAFMFRPKHNRRLQKWFASKAEEQFHHKVDLPDGVGRVNVPTAEFNIIFQLAHVYNHLLHEGIGLRQIIDYYYVLKSNNNFSSHEDNIDFIEKRLRYLGLWKIAGAMMWVLHEKLGLNNEYLIAPIDERRGKVLLDEIMKGGNFGKYDAKNIKANNRFKKNILRLKRDFQLMFYFPSECLWEPVFRIYHLFWRMRYN